MCKQRAKDKVRVLITTMVGFLFSGLVLAGQKDSVASSQQAWNAHFQQTVVVQYHPPFSARYSGVNSLQATEPGKTSLTSTLYLGVRLWGGAEMYMNAELEGGSGLSGATGVAGFPNGETFRVGEVAPKASIVRGFLRQTVAFGENSTVVDDEANQLQGKIPETRLSVTLGKISIADFFDQNEYSNDPRTQFLNWGLMNSGAWDYPADTRGYTWGVVVEYAWPQWAIKLSGALVPTEANRSVMDLHIGSARSEAISLEHEYVLADRKGTFRVLGFRTLARMGNYQEALHSPGGVVEIADTRAERRTKYGFAVSVQQELSPAIGAFLRGSWNDGTNETWMFTEIDRSVAGGVLIDGSLWSRRTDKLGIAFLVNGISEDHRAYLQAGGYGFMIGDGGLHYAAEMIGEVFYSLPVIDNRIWLTGDYQFVEHPAYNPARAPLHVLALRTHVEI